MQEAVRVISRALYAQAARKPGPEEQSSATTTVRAGNKMTEEGDHGE